MALYENFPYTNYHDINLDRIIEQVMEVKEGLKFVIDNASLKYADPIQWNITRQYQANTVVIDPATGIAYISTKPVPDNIQITDTGYWTPIFDLNDLFSDLADETQARINADTALGDRIDTEIENRQTADQTLANADTALGERIDLANQAITELSDNVGDLYLVDAKNFGVIGDGITDDTNAIQALLDAGKSVYLSEGTYKTTRPLHMKTGCIRGAGFNTIIECTPASAGCAIVMCGAWSHLENLRLQYASSVDVSNASAGRYIGLVTYTYASDDSYQNQRTKHSKLWIRHVGTGITSDNYYGNPSPITTANLRAPFSVHFDTIEIQDFSHAGIKFEDDYCSGNIFTNIYITSPTGSVVNFDNPVFGTADYGFYIVGQERPEIHLLNVEWGLYRYPVYFYNCNGIGAGTIHLEQVGASVNDVGLVQFEHSSGSIQSLSVFYTRLGNRTGQYVIMLHDAGYHTGNVNAADWSEIVINHLTLEGLNTGIGLSNINDAYFLYRPAAATGRYVFEVKEYTYRTYYNDKTKYDNPVLDPNNSIDVVAFGTNPVYGLLADRPTKRLCRNRSVYYASDTHETFVWDGTAWVSVSSGV